MRKFEFLRLGVVAGLLGTADVSLAGEVGSGFEVVHYEVRLRPDVEAATVSGQQVMHITITSSDVTQLAFSPNALTVAEAQIDGRSVDVRSGKDAIVFSLASAYPVGTSVSLSFSYRGVPARGLTVTPGGIYTGYFACEWMICLQDAPGDKATVALDLFLPTGMRSLGVGRQVSTTDLGNGLSLHRWRSDRPTSPYLLAFAAGQFPEHVQDIPQGKLFYLDGTGEAADLETLFSEVPAMVAFLSERAGVGLPDERYYQLLVPGRVAQETMTFSLIGLRELELEAEDPSSGWVIIHELSHQWWGNRVTTKTWGDFWLNEGFATYMAAAWKQHRYGEQAYQKELDVLRGRRQRLQELGYDKPLTWAGLYPSLAHRRTVQYSKGALFLSVLRETVGDEAFWRGLKAYTQENLDSTVESVDFQRAMEEASDADLGPLFAEWVYVGDEPAVAGVD